MSKSVHKCAPPRKVWGHALPENFLDSRFSEMGSSAI